MSWLKPISIRTKKENRLCVRIAVKEISKTDPKAVGAHLYKNGKTTAISTPKLILIKAVYHRDAAAKHPQDKLHMGHLGTVPRIFLTRFS